MMKSYGSSPAIPGAVSKPTPRCMLKPRLANLAKRLTGLDACKDWWAKSHLAPAAQAAENYPVPHVKQGSISHKSYAPEYNGEPEGCGGGNRGCAEGISNVKSCNCERESNFAASSMKWGCDTAGSEVPAKGGDRSALTNRSVEPASSPSLGLLTHFNPIAYPAYVDACSALSTHFNPMAIASRIVNLTEPILNFEVAGIVPQADSTFALISQWHSMDMPQEANECWAWLKCGVILTFFHVKFHHCYIVVKPCPPEAMYYLSFGPGGGKTSKAVKDPEGVWKYDVDKNKDSDHTVEIVTAPCEGMGKGKDVCDCFKKMRDELDGKFKYYVIAENKASEPGINSNTAARLIWNNCVGKAKPPTFTTGWGKVPTAEDLAEGVKPEDAKGFLGK